MRVELTDPEGAILQEIFDPQMTRDDVALTYAMALRGSQRVDWAKVNHAILDRWSMAALKYVKNKAWKIAEGKVAP